jgi:CSLREA domain-containing protein
MSRNMSSRGLTSGRWARALLTLIFGIVLALALFAGPAMADTFTVDSTGDAKDADSGNGTCATSGGECTLRAAIEEANDLAGADTINFAPSVSGTITLGGTQLIISSDLDLNGPGAGTLTVDANRASRVFNITNTGDATVKGLTATGGSTTTSGGGIFNNGTLTLDSSTVNGNSTELHGAGIYNNIGDTLTVTNSTISGNYASAGFHGGGIYNGDGTLTLNNSTVSGNYAAFYGGGIYSSTDSVGGTSSPAESGALCVDFCNRCIFPECGSRHNAIPDPTYSRADFSYLHTITQLVPA